MVRAHENLLEAAKKISGDTRLVTWFHLPGEQTLCGCADSSASVCIQEMRINTRAPRIWKDVDVTQVPDKDTSLIWLYATVQPRSMTLYRWYNSKGQDEHVLVVSDDGEYGNARQSTKQRQEAYKRRQRFAHSTGQPSAIIHKIMQILGRQATLAQVELCLSLLESITKKHPDAYEACRILKQFRQQPGQDLKARLVADYGLHPSVEAAQAVILTRAVRAAAFYMKSGQR